MSGGANVHRWRIENKHQLDTFTQWATQEIEKGNKHIVQITDANRSLDQNAMAFQLYRQIAEQLQDQSIVDVRRTCKLHYGVPIRRAYDDEFNQMYGEAIKPMSYELKLLLMDHLPVTSKFSKAMFTEYLGVILDEYQKQGLHLEDPSK